MVQLLDHRGPGVLGATAWDVYASKKKHAAAIAGMDIPKTAEDVRRFNRATRGKPTGLTNPWHPRLPQPPHPPAMPPGAGRSTPHRRIRGAHDPFSRDPKGSAYAVSPP